MAAGALDWLVNIQTDLAEAEGSLLAEGLESGPTARVCRHERSTEVPCKSGAAFLQMEILIGSKFILPPNSQGHEELSSAHRRTGSPGSDDVAPKQPPSYHRLGLHAEMEPFDSSKPSSTNSTKNCVQVYLKELREATLNIELI